MMVTSRETNNEWFQCRAHAAAIAVILLGFLARLWTASGTFLNPDEALHFRLANQPSLQLAYQQSLTASHPPLLTVVLYFWRALGTSELWLRLPLVLAGLAFCWMFYKWLTNAAGNLTGFIGLLYVAFLPPVILLSAEIRQYPLLLAFLASALYFLQEAFTRKSAANMAEFSLCLYLAMLSHYSAFLFAAALGIYALLRMITDRPPVRVVAAWAIGQIGALVLAAFLYRTHLSKLGAGESRTVLQGWMSEFFLHRSYFEPGRDNPLLFVISHSFGVFQFVFGQLAVGDLAGLLFLAGLVFLIRGSAGPTTSQTASRHLALFLILAFALVCGACLAHIYPYGGTRHSSILIIPAVAGVSIAIAHLTRGRWDRASAVAALIVALCVLFGKQHQPYMKRSDQGRRHMTEAMDWLRTNAASPDLVFTDYESELILGHYLCRQKPITFEESSQDFEAFSCDGIRVVSASYKTATLFDATSFVASWNRLVRTYRLKGGNTIWIVQAGWKVDLAEDLQTRFAEFRDMPVISFGSNIRIFKLTVGQPVPAITVISNHFPASRFSPSARRVISSAALRPSFFVTTPKLPE